VDGIQQLLEWTGLNPKPMPIQVAEKPQPAPVVSQAVAQTTAQSSVQTMAQPVSDEETRVRVVAFAITARFEGGSYASYQNYDEGIVSYGRFQFTVTGGLYTVLNTYTQASTSDAAKALQGYLERVQSADETLRKDEAFKMLLKQAADDPIMQMTQDQVATRIYWDKIHDLAITPRAFILPLSRALLFDIAINFGMGDAFVRKAEQELGVPEKSIIGENGITEEALMTRVAQLRKASHDRQAERDNLPGLKVRGDFWVDLARAGDWHLQGDADGNLSVKNRPIQARQPQQTTADTAPSASLPADTTLSLSESQQPTTSIQAPVPEIEDATQTAIIATDDEAKAIVEKPETTIIEATASIVTIVAKGNKGVNIRSAPRNGAVIVTAKADDHLTLVNAQDADQIGQRGQWVQVTHPNGTQGYTAAWLFTLLDETNSDDTSTTTVIQKPETTITETASAIIQKPATAIVETIRTVTIVAKGNKGVNIRSAPKTGAVVAVAQADDNLTLLNPDEDADKIGQAGQWVQVAHPNSKDGYTAAWLFNIADDQTITIEPPQIEQELPIPDDLDQSVDAPNGDEAVDEPQTEDTINDDVRSDEADDSADTSDLDANDDDEFRLDTSAPIVGTSLDINPTELDNLQSEFAVADAPNIPISAAIPDNEAPVAAASSTIEATAATGMNLDLYHPLGTPDPAALGNIKWVRFLYNVSFNPDIPEGDPARYGNTDLDATMQRYRPILEQYAKAGKKVILVFTHQTYGEGQGMNLGAMSDEQWSSLSERFAEIVGEIAEQYQADQMIHALQIWNEQDAHEGAVASIPLRPNVYGDMLGKTIQAVRKVDKTIPIITGGHASGPGAGAPYAKATMANMPDGIRPDGIAFHPYGRGDMKSEAKYRHYGNIDESIKAYADVLPDAPLWITEWGVLDAPTEPPAGIGKYTQEFVERLREVHEGKVIAAMWYAWAQGMHNGYGVVDAEGNPRPPFTAVYTGL
ncbi:MAG: chitosanase, partial [Phototrophicaceae bacterium]